MTEHTHTPSPPINCPHVGGVHQTGTALSQKHVSVFRHCDTRPARHILIKHGPHDTTQHLEVTMETKNTAAACGGPPPPDLATAVTFQIEFHDAK